MHRAEVARGMQIRVTVTRLGAADSDSSGWRSSLVFLAPRRRSFHRCGYVRLLYREPRSRLAGYQHSRCDKTTSVRRRLLAPGALKRAFSVKSTLFNFYVEIQRITEVGDLEVNLRIGDADDSAIDS